MNDLAELLQIALGKAENLKEPWDEARWNTVFEQAVRQSVIGVCYRAIQKLPEDFLPPIQIKVQWGLVYEDVVASNELMDRHSAEITKAVLDYGFRSCILKGQGLALLYPWPEARQSGDVDLWMEGDYEKIISFLKKHWKLEKCVYHNAEVNCFNDETCLEIHYRPAWLNNPFDNGKLQRWFRDMAPAQFDRYLLDKGFAAPDVAFNLVFCMVHICRHILNGGIGVRQLLDYYFILLHSNSEDRSSAFRFLASVHLARFVAVVMFAMRELFALDENLFLCDPDAKYGPMLLKEIECSGNFGLFDSRNDGLRSENVFVRTFAYFRRIARFIKIAPSEVLWSPYFKVFHLFWRASHRY